MTVLSIDRVRFRSVLPEVQETGLLGWVSFHLDGVVQIDGVAVRRTRDGRLALSFPDRRHPRMRPLNDRARRAIEAQVFAALEAQGIEL